MGPPRRAAAMRVAWGRDGPARSARRGAAGGLRRLAERLERVHARQAVERAALDLLGLLRAHPELAADPGAGALLAPRAQAQGDDPALVPGGGGQRLDDRLREDGPVDLLLGRLVVGGAEVAERGGVGVVAELHVQARRRVVDGADLLDLLDLHAGDSRDLVELGLALELHRELVADAADLARLRRDVGGQADGTGGVVEAALDRLPDPQRGVRREAEALAPVELLGRADQAQHALLDEVVQGEAVALVAAGDGDDEPQVRVDQAVLGEEVAALDALGELDLLGGLQQLEAVRALQQLLERVRVDVALMLFADLSIRLGGQDPPDRNPICSLGIIPSFGCVRNRRAGARSASGRRNDSSSGRGKPAGRTKRTAGDLESVANIRSPCADVTLLNRMKSCSSPISSPPRRPSRPRPRAGTRWPGWPRRCAGSSRARSAPASRSCRANCASARSASAGPRCATRRPAAALRPS